MIGYVFSILYEKITCGITTSLLMLLNMIPTQYGNSLLIPYYYNGRRYQVLIPVSNTIAYRKSFVDSDGLLILSYMPPPGIKHFIDHTNVSSIGKGVKIHGICEE